MVCHNDIYVNVQTTLVSVAIIRFDKFLLLGWAEVIDKLLCLAISQLYFVWYLKYLGNGEDDCTSPC